MGADGRTPPPTLLGWRDSNCRWHAGRLPILPTSGWLPPALDGRHPWGRYRRTESLQPCNASWTAQSTYHRLLAYTRTLTCTHPSWSPACRKLQLVRCAYWPQMDYDWAGLT